MAEAKGLARDFSARLEAVADELWLAEGEVVSFYGFPYPTRAAIARLPNGSLWIWSPIKLDLSLRKAVDALGRVAHLVSPNKLHHLYLAEWKAAYPEATLWGPLSTIRRHPELVFAAPLEDESPPEWGGAFDQAWFRGSPTLDEIVFFHRRSRTALVADLIQAFDEAFLRTHWRGWKYPFARLGGIDASHPGAPKDWRLTFFNRVPARAARAKDAWLGLRESRHCSWSLAEDERTRLPPPRPRLARALRERGVNWGLSKCHRTRKVSP